MYIAIGADHRGFALKAHIKQYVVPHESIAWIDVGTATKERTDYPPYAKSVVDALKNEEAQWGILICASGIGMAIAANRFTGMRAGVAWNSQIATMCKEDDNVNILVLPSDFVSPEQAVIIIEHWLSARFKGGRYQERITMIDDLGSD